MKRHPESIAFDKWLASKEGQRCADPTTVRPSTDFRQYMENRLSLAFRAGANYAEQALKSLPATPEAK